MTEGSADVCVGGAAEEGGDFVAGEGEDGNVDGGRRAKGAVAAAGGATRVSEDERDGKTATLTSW